MKLIKGEFKERLELQFAQAVKAGFPSPAEDYMGESLDFNRDLIRNHEATFYALVEGRHCRHRQEHRTAARRCGGRRYRQGVYGEVPRPDAQG